MVEKQCVTCRGKGHTYMECPRLSFGSVVVAAFGLPSLATGETASELRERVRDTNEQLRNEKQEAHRRGEIGFRSILVYCGGCGTGGAVVTRDPEERERWVGRCDSCTHADPYASEGVGQ